MSLAVEKMKALLATKNVVSKDFSIGDAFKVTCVKAKPYQTDTGLLLPVVGVSAKFVPKFSGYQTLFYLESGEITGSFSMAASDFAESLFNMANVALSDYARLDFDKPIMVRITQEEFTKVFEDDPTKKPEQWSTYNFDIVSGEAEQFNISGGIGTYTNILGAVDTLSELAAHTETETETAELKTEPETETPPPAKKIKA